MIQLILSILISQALAAYPHARTVLEKTAKNNGHGTYLIEQEIQFQQESESVSLRETWTVQDGETLECVVRVPTADGQYVRALAVLYKNGSRYSIDDSGSVNQAHLPQDFFEPLFHFRSLDGFGSFLVGNKWLPPGALAVHKLLNMKNFKYEADPHVMPARVGNTVTLAIGPSLPNGKVTPRLWIDQDHFNIRKIKFPSQAEVLAENVEPYSHSLEYPKDRTVSWDEHAVQIHTLSVKWVGEKDNRISPGQLADERPSRRLPNLAIINEFYTRFR